MTTTIEQFQAAVAELSDDDFAKDGAPKITPLNAALKAAEAPEVDAEARDALWAEMNPPEVEEAPTDTVKLTITDAPYNPVIVLVNGMQLARLRVGDQHEVTQEVIDALHNAGGITYEIEEEDQTDE